ncbi:MAG: aminotransferase class IV [Pseudomonadota bacterium]
MPDASDAVTAHDAEIDARNDDILIWIDGRLVPRAQATVSVYDSGFLLGDGIWEGLRLRNAKWAFVDDHLDRLFEAARALDLDLTRDRAAFRQALEDVRAANGMTDHAHARLMVTRGPKIRPFQHPSLSRSGPTTVIIAEHSRPAAALAGQGVRLATVPQVRGLPMSQDPKLNSHSKLNCVLAAVQAEKAGADEGLMLDPHGWVNTTNSCNFFIVRRGEVWTSTGDYCMPGITRAHTLQLCREAGIPAFEKNFSLTEVFGAEEAFLTGTFSGQTPVREIDGRAYDHGPVTRRLQALYADLVARETA